MSPVQYPPAGILTQRQVPGIFEQQRQKEQQQEIIKLKLEELRSQIEQRRTETKLMGEPKP